MKHVAWVPLNDNHAIFVMAAYIRFSSALPDLLLRRVLRAIAPITDELGLKSVSAAQRMQLTFGADGISTSSAPPLTGQVFTRRPPVADGDESPLKSLEQLAVEPERIIYRTWDYVSWTASYERIKALFEPVLEIVGGSVFYEAIGLEYIDRFRLEPGLDREEALSTLLRVDSDLLAPHIFQAESLFHSHTGWFSKSKFSAQQLQVVRVDAVDEKSAEDVDSVRLVNITTLQEDRFPADEERDDNPDPFAVWSATHSGMKELLARVITAEQAARIYLEG